MANATRRRTTESAASVGSRGRPKAEPPGWPELGAPAKRVSFSRVFLNGFSLPPSDACRVVSVSGDGMEPTMSDGDKILIDARFTVLVDGRVYTVSTPEGVVTRRARRWRQGWLLVRDKPGRPSMALPANAKVLGEVRWVARTLRPDEPTDELLAARGPGACGPVAGGSAGPGKR